MWNKETEKDFEELKKVFTEGGIQAFRDFWGGKPIHTHHRLEQGEPPGSTGTSTGQSGTVLWLLGEEVQQV